MSSADCYRGSAHTVSLDDVRREPGWELVNGVPLIRQRSAHDCGAAALAMVLERWGIPDASPDIRRSFPAPPGRGLTAGALRQFARDKGLRAFVISAMTADLVNEVRADRPVIVGLVQRYTGNESYAHYEVVIGFNLNEERVLLLDPGRGPREDNLRAFDQEWRASDRLAVVVLAPS